MSLVKIPKGVFALGFVSMFMDISSEMIHSVLPIFLTSVVGASALAVGILEGVAESTAAVMKVFSGAFSDWIGKRKPLLLAGYGLAAATRPFFVMAESFWTVLFARFADRVGKGIRGAPRDALLADITPHELRGNAYGLRQSMDTTGAFLGPLAAMLLLLAAPGGFRLVFAAAIIPAVAVILIIIFRVREPDIPRNKEKMPFPLQKRELKLLPSAFWFVTLLAAVLTLARFSEAFLILRGDSLGLKAAFAPLILIVMNVVYTLSAWPAGVLSDRFGKSRFLAAGIGVLIAADIVMAQAESIAMVFLGTALWGLHMGLTQGILTAMIADRAPIHLRGTAFGVFNLVSGGALLLASIIAGWLWNDYGPSAAFHAGAVFSAVSLLGFFLLNGRYKRKT